MICPFCHASNIEGVDQCEHCQQPIDFLSQPTPGSDMERGLMRDRVMTLVPRAPVVVAPSRSVRDTLNLMSEQNIGCVVVVEAGQVVGMFTERDVLVKLNEETQELGDRPVSDFMTASPETIEADTEIAFALHKMDIGGYRHLPVLFKGRIIGVLSIRDILRYVTDRLTMA